MSNFIRTVRFSSYINLDHVARVVQFKTEKQWRQRYYDAHDNEIGETGDEVDVEIEATPVVPAAPGAAATLLWVDSLDDTRPTETDICTEVVPIVAWRIMGLNAIPVFVETVADSQYRLIHIPGKRLLHAEDRSFDDIAEAREHFLRRAQQAWDETHSAAA